MKKFLRYILVISIMILIAASSLFSSAVTFNDTNKLSVNGVTLTYMGLHRKFSDWETSDTNAEVVLYSPTESDTYDFYVSIDAEANGGSWSPNSGAPFRLDYVLNFDNFAGNDTVQLSFDVNVVLLNSSGSSVSYSEYSSYSSIKSSLLSTNEGKVTYNGDVLKYTYTGQGNNFNVSTAWRLSSGTAYRWKITIENIQIKAAGIQDIIDSQKENTEEIIENQNENTDKILNAGSDVAQPDFDSTNDDINNTVGQMTEIEDSYKIDQATTEAALNEGSSFWQGSDMSRASVQVKNWIERFGNENTVMYGFFIAVMTLSLCFWILGRKA